MKQQTWQFSLRSLLVLTSILSIVLATAVKLPELFRAALYIAAPVLLVIVIFHAANFATSDRRPALSMLSWMLFAAFFALYSMAIISVLFQAGGNNIGWPHFALAVMATCFLVCLYRAGRSYLLIRRRGIVTGIDGDRDQNQAQAANSAAIRE